MAEIIIGLVKVGFHGAAIAMAILSYRLLNRLVETWGPNTSGDNKSILTTQLTAVRNFMYMCVALFLVGIVAQVMAPLVAPSQTSARIEITPAKWPKNLASFEETIKVKHDRDTVQFDDGIASIDIYEKDMINVRLSGLVDKLNSLDRDYRTLLTSQSPGRGFGDE